MSRVACHKCGWRERGDPRVVEAAWNRHYATAHKDPPDVRIVLPEPRGRRRKGA